MAKKKNNRKKKPARQFQKIKPENYIKQHARKVPIYECLVQEGWKEEQFTMTVVSRKKQNGNYVVGTYIVDMQCLGVKDTGYFADMDDFEYGEYKTHMEESLQFTLEKIDPTLCFNIIYGAIEFAEDCGFQPHKDFAITEYILEDVTTIDYIEVPLGVDGKPSYVAGPYDNADKILATLIKTKGEGNFYFSAHMMPDRFGGPTTTKRTSELLVKHFPEDIIDNKLDSLSEEQQGELGLQLQIASNVMIAGDGNIDFINQQHEADEDFFDAIFQTTLRQMEEDSPLEELDITDDDYEILQEVTLWVLEKIIDLGGPSFLWEKDYLPTPQPPTPEELFNLSEEELDALEEKRMFYMTRAARDTYILRMFLTTYTKDYKLIELQNKEIQEKVVKAYLQGLKEMVFKDRWDQETEEYCKELAFETLTDLSSISDEKPKI